MPLDIQLFREDRGGDLAKVRKSQADRFDDMKDIDEVLAVDAEWRNVTGALDRKNAEKRLLSKPPGKGRDLTPEERQKIKANKKGNKEEIAELTRKKKELEILRDQKLALIGNIVHKSVPVSHDEKDNEIITRWGDPREKAATDLDHHILLYRIGGYEPNRGANVAGHRGYFLTGPGVILNLALQQYGIAFLTNQKHKYTAVQPPYFMNQGVMAATAQLSQFDEELYHVTGEHMDIPKYLIATSEQPISAMHMKEWLKPKELPIKYAGISTCFRKEAGGHGKDVWGIFRVHQFEKIEQFVICGPDDSWQLHEEMLKTSEEFYQSLNLPYQVVTIVSGELNNAAAKKYDLEAWFPCRQQYKELVSCSNCTDYQSRAMETRFGQKQSGDRQKNYAHMLNSTLCATTRTICCILENYQTEEGVRVPEVLIPYCGGVDFFPFVRPYPKKSMRPHQLNPSNKKKNDLGDLKSILGKHDIDVNDVLEKDLKAFLKSRKH